MAVRPIDGEALWDKLEDALWYDNYDRDMAEKIVLDMPTLTPPNEWVSVEDAMPPELKMVLVYSGGLYDVAGWVKDEADKICWTCKTEPEFWRPIPELGG